MKRNIVLIMALLSLLVLSSCGSNRTMQTENQKETVNVQTPINDNTDANDEKDETLLAETEEQNEQTAIEKTDNKESEVFSIDTVKKMSLKECFLDGDMGIVHTDMTLGEFFSDKYFNDAEWRFCDIIDGKENAVSLMIRTVPNLKWYRLDFRMDNNGHIYYDFYSIKNIGNGTTTSSATPVAMPNSAMREFIKEVYTYYGIE